jgi:chaperonin GroES
MAKFTPLLDQVLVRRVEEAQVTRGGIIVPDTAKEKPLEGEVIAAGKGGLTTDGKQIQMVVKPGDRVLFKRYGGTEVKIDGEDFLIMEQREILGIIEGAPSSAKKETAGAKK